ncbi:unnamed protein product, partial [Ixodes persulcatus]
GGTESAGLPPRPSRHLPRVDWPSCSCGVGEGRYPGAGAPAEDGSQFGSDFVVRRMTAPLEPRQPRSRRRAGTRCVTRRRPSRPRR